MADDYDLTPNPDRGNRRTIQQIMDPSSKKSSNDSSGTDTGSDSSSSSSSSSDSSDDYDEKKDTVITTGIIDTYEKALAFAKLTWNKIRRDDGRTVQLQTWGMTVYQPGEWARVYLPSFDIDDYMYITNTSHSNDGGDWTCNLTLVDFPPGWGKEEKEEEEDEDEEDSEDENETEESSESSS